MFCRQIYLLVTRNHTISIDNTSQTDIAQQYGCSQSCIENIKPESRLSARCSGKKHRKRKFTGKADYIEKALFIWFTDVRARDAPVTTLIEGQAICYCFGQAF